MAVEPASLTLVQAAKQGDVADSQQHGLSLLLRPAELCGSNAWNVGGVRSERARWRESKRPGTGYVLLLDFVNSSDLFALVTPPGWTKVSKGGFELYRSLDGGGTWTLVRADVPATSPPGFLQFVDLKCGFESNVNGATELLTTRDGGVSWNSITPAIAS
jgi:hypothetical protein